MKTVINHFGLMLLLVTIINCQAIAGNIDPSGDGSQYAWGENIGWINFDPSLGPGVTITNTNLTGDAWAENVGWIRLNPIGGGVIHDGSGNLSGYAWGENIGWISFSCGNTDNCSSSNYGVFVDPVTGVLTGKAWGENVGWIVFDYNTSSSHGVKSFWGSCAGDSDTDSDIDGADLSQFLTLLSNGRLQNNDIATFGGNYGSDNCELSLPLAAAVSQQSSSESTYAMPINNTYTDNGVTLVSSSYNSMSTTTSFPDTQVKNEKDAATIYWESIIKEVNWNNSDGQTGYAIGPVEWQIKDIQLHPGITLLTVSVIDTAGNVSEKTIEIINNDILSEKEKYNTMSWIRKLSYAYNFDDSFFKETTPTPAELTLLCWPDKIIITDDYLSTEPVKKNYISKDDTVEFVWSVECDIITSTTLFLDMPTEKMVEN